MFLAQYIDTMAEWIADDPELPGERERIIKERILTARLDGAEEEELELIEKALQLAGKAGAGGAGD